MHSPRLTWTWTWLLTLALTVAVVGGTPRTWADETPAPDAATKPTGNTDFYFDDYVEGQDDFDTQLKTLKQLIPRAKRDHVALLEGLPRDVGQREVLKLPNVKKLHGYYFYTPVKVLLKAERDALLNILLNPARFQRTAIKMCGGFHPDYALMFRIDREMYAFMICFGCDDVVLYNVETGAYYMAEPTGNTMALLYPLLFAHRRFRPLNTMPR